MLMPALLLMLAPQDTAAAANDADLKCMAIFSALASQAKEADQPGLVSGIMFFYGKIAGRSPAFDVEAGMLRILKADPDGKGLEAERMRCAQEMQKRGEALSKMGERISAAGGQ